MRRAVSLFLGLVLAFLLAGCGGNLTDKEKIAALYHRNEALFAAAVGTGDYSAVEKLRGVREVTLRGGGGEVEFCCGGFGIGSGTSYYGILYLENAAVFAEMADSSPEWAPEGEGYRFRQADGDNEFYYEPLGNGFFYYEEHF